MTGTSSTLLPARGKGEVIINGHTANKRKIRRHKLATVSPGGNEEEIQLAGASTLEAGTVAEVQARDRHSHVVVERDNPYTEDIRTARGRRRRLRSRRHLGSRGTRRAAAPGGEGGRDAPFIHKYNTAGVSVEDLLRGGVAARLHRQAVRWQVKSKQLIMVIR